MPFNLTDGHYTYCRQPLPGSIAHHHTLSPRAFSDFIPRERLAQSETGLFLPTTYNIPHLRMAVPSTHHLDAPDFNPLYDVQADPTQTTPIHDPAIEARLANQLRELLAEYDAPTSQYARVGL